MNSFRMKALSVAVLGLSGLGMAGSAFAVCPTDPAVSGGGAWSSKSALSGNLAITSPGLAGTACTLQVSINQNATVIGKAVVTDTSPQDEPRYRARFYISTAEIGAGLTGSNLLRNVAILNASATSGPAGKSGEEVRISLTGANGVPTVTFTIADSNQGSGFQQVSAALPVAAGVNRIEFDLQGGATGSFRYWLSNETDVTTDGAPTGTVSPINTTAWSGVTQANLGVFAASTNYRSFFSATTHAYVDEFDSRRQTFIGK